MMMVYIGLPLAIVVVVLWLMWWTGLRSRMRWWFHRVHHNHRQEAEQQFIEATVRRMEEEPRAAEAIYAQSQHHDSNPALVVAYIALLTSAFFAMDDPATLSNDATWGAMFTGIITYLAAPFAVFGVIYGVVAMARTSVHAQLYGKVIDRYCDRLRLPKRP